MDSQHTELQSNADQLSNLVVVAGLMLEAQAAVVAAEESLRKAKEQERRLREQDLPELMREAGMTEFKLADGTRLTLRDDVRASIPAARREEAFAWLVANGFGGLIKTEVTVTFGRGERDEARTAAVAIRNTTNHDADVVETVHPQTLLAFLREQREAGRSVPEELFGVAPYSEVKAQLPRKAAAAKAA